MRRWIATLSTAAVAAMITPVLAAPAHAAQPVPAGPVTALKRQFAAGHGVKVTQTMTSVDFYGGSAKNSMTTRYEQKGTYLFGSSKVVGSDLTFQFKGPGGAWGSPLRLISFPKVSYLRDDDLLGNLPEGKEWLRGSGDEPFLMSFQPVNVLEPATLKRLLATTASTGRGGRIDGARTTLHRGVITVDQLYAVSPSFRSMVGEKPRGDSATMQVRWKLWLDGRQRTRQLVSAYAESTQNLRYSSRSAVTVKTRFSGWGAKVALYVPPAASVAGWEDLQFDESVPARPRLSVPVPGRGA
ncbi:hypothetical protein GCM10010156_61510 [Planobispora rosea]|uniref:Uncharacterized protein n=1 Tax=Planobispora rosea TaxID=35762 RepID=A0A8J3WG59_PLARO|nr:hypothetical protein [Planobispora rosea]GGS94936.1 hypothetical protein GCM10010156_61510 [Planobispora rosea]GIH87452.1 hypothetical protein Pro02_58600 [Planobispora rosea]